MSETIKTSQPTPAHDRAMSQHESSDGNAKLNDYGEDDIVELDGMDVAAVATREPHFLDYDAVPPPELEESYARAMKFNALHGEQIKMEKKYERDGEVSDYELAASGYTKKEFTQDDNTLFFASVVGTTKVKNAKAKHFLDENPIPPDYMLAQELREHRSLDRNFERQSEQQKHKQAQLAVQSKSSLSAERTSSSLFSGSKYAGSEVGAQMFSNMPQLPRGAAWAKRFDEHYCNMPIPLPTVDSACVDVTLGSKVECVYSLLSMLGSKDPLEIAKKFFELSENTETCATLRRSGCIPLLVQMLHSAENDESVRKYAGMALQNVVHRHPDEKAGRREAKVMRLLDQIMDYCNFLKSLLQSGGEAIADDSDRHPLAAISSLMKVSFDEEHRHAMCELGGLHAIPNLVHLDHAVHGPKPEDQCCNSLRRYALMALTNLTFGDENNKALLCSQKLFMEALIAQLDAAPDDLLQVTASVLRNLSWRADSNMKAVLNEIGTVTALARAAMSNKNENTLKAILSALWNLSAHCSTNKAEFCAVEGALAFLVNMLTYEGPSKTLKIIENAGGILRNVSSHIAVCESYRQILREHNCLSILLQQLKSESLTVVSNSCGTLWNLSARCPEDQKFLWDNGAIPMLRSLIHSKHAMISEGSSSALKNLLNFRPAVQNQNRMDPIARSLGLKKLPTLNVRKQKALQQELGESTHAETSDNLDDEDVPVTTTKQNEQDDDGPNAKLPLNAALDMASKLAELSINAKEEQTARTSHPSSSNQARISRSATLAKSESRDSIFSSKSDSEYENIRRSHSASDANRSGAGHSSHMAYELENDVEITEEQPIDYSVKYNENSTLAKELDNTSSNENGAEANSSYPTYQETDLDQLTDFSLRYGENQIESDADNLPAVVSDRQQQQSGECKGKEVKSVEERSEILLILEDSVKCYQTEDTPYIISNAASITDLRQGGKTEAACAVDSKPSGEDSLHNKRPQKLMQYGSYTPEKPINYCEEGTPGYFSRYDSLSSLDEAAAEVSGRLKLDDASTSKTNLAFTNKATAKHNIEEAEAKIVIDVGEVTTSNLNSALETPLMFSRRSSMDSLVNEDVGPCDDKSSVVSDFSRLASGVISPSEIPDSPTQSMPESPRRNSVGASVNQSVIIQYRNGVRVSTDAKRTLHSVFEDDISKFNVENTPAQFSCATSLSNLSIVDDEPNLPPVADGQKLICRDDVMSSQRGVHQNTISEGEEDDVNINNNDDLLLASCINMGMNRASEHANKGNKNQAEMQMLGDEPKHYCTEDTPALLSKVGSNTNLSIISSMDCSRKDEIAYEMRNTNSHNLSDEVSSNASDCGAIGLAGADLLQQCILDGMKKSTPMPKTFTRDDPIAMMRRGGNILPPYLPVSDEMSKYLVEDSPCNFSVVSGLSNLTVGSSLVGPAVQLQDNGIATTSKAGENAAMAASVNSKEDVRRDQLFPDDSLSSLSIDSEDDTNLLSQAIAAGCNRPKSNLGFNTATSIDKRTNLISASQPIPILTASSTSSLTTTKTTRHYRKQQHVLNNLHRAAIGNNESYSSVDSSDSNDNQSKSLFEFSILTGMYKTSDEAKSSKRSRGRNDNEASSSHSNPNLKQFDSLPMPLAAHRNTQRQLHRHHHQQQQQQQQQHHRERELKDEKLLLECIKTGISKKVNSGEELATATAHGGSASHEQMRSGGQHSDVPKNGRATSAAALAQCHQMAPIISTSANDTAAAPDVEMNMLVNYLNSYSSNNNNSNTGILLADDIINAAENQTPTVTPTKLRNHNESQLNHETITKSKMKVNTTGSNFNTEHNIFKDVDVADDGDDTDDDADSKSSQSFMLDTPICLDLSQTVSAPTIADKHRDPDLMLKSVERLTMEFVTSAEQLRTQVGGNLQAAPRPVNKRMCELLAEDTATTTNSTSSNTWNEHSCPNDISFPSVSVSAPMLTSLNTTDDADHEKEEVDPATDADFSKLHDYVEHITENALNGQLTQPNSIETETDTLVNEQIPLDMMRNFELTPKPNGIHFELGGEVQSAAAAVAGSNNQLFLFNGTSASIMSNSTIIAYEARALSDNLRQLNDDPGELTFSMNSLDLDNIRPPSGMESLNISGCYNEQPSSMQYSSATRTGFPAKSPKFLRKTLPPGLLAKRALGQLAGSAESVNSSCNLLDNIKPPSLMDELLDSMASVASIQSEVADGENHSMATTISLSNYETAASGQTFDDNTVTLQSCCGSMPHDDAEDEDDDATFNDFSSAGSTPKQTSPGGNSGRRTLTPKQKRLMAKDRYRTYTICSPLTPSERAYDELLETEDTLQVEIVKHSGESSLTDERRRQSSTESADHVFVATIIDGKQQNILEKSVIDDAEDMDTQQNSETESCHGQDEKLCIISAAHSVGEVNADAQATYEVPKAKPESPKLGLNKHKEETAKCVRGRKKPAYISPYSYQQRSSSSSKSLVRATSKVAAEKPNRKPFAAEDKAIAAAADATVRPLGRQGTFVKDEPTNTAVHVPVVVATTPTTLSPNHRASKLPTKRTLPLAATTHKRTTHHSSNTTGGGSSSSNNSFLRRTTTTTATATHSVVRKLQTKTATSAAAGPQRSNTNIRLPNARANASNRAAAQANAVSRTTPPSRSNSNLNGSNDALISQAQSRIANIWKRVGDAKAKQLLKPVTAAAAAPAGKIKAQKSTDTTESSSKALNSRVATPHKPALIRSSTFESTPRRKTLQVTGNVGGNARK